jgi:hypothetical protein
VTLIIGLLALVAFIGGIALFAFSFFWPSIEREVKQREEDGSYKTDRYGNPVTVTKTETMPGKRLALVGGILLVIAGFFGLGIRIIEPGTTGVVITAGQVQDTERGTGITWVVPFVDDIKNFNIRVRTYEFEGYAAASKEYQDVFLFGVINYRVVPNEASKFFTQLNEETIEQDIIEPKFAQAVKAVMPNYGIASVLANREAISEQTKDALNARVAEYGLIIDDIPLANVDFNPEYNDAIKNKQIQELQRCRQSRLWLKPRVRLMLSSRKRRVMQRPTASCLSP